MSSSGTFLYPNVSHVPSRGEAIADRKPKDGAQPGEFGRVFDEALQGVSVPKSDDLQQLKSPLKFSAHASQRMQDRKINLDQQTMARVNEAVDKAAAKGVEDTLVLTNGAALIVNVPNRTVVTAMDRNSLNGNVFTNIDGAVIV